MICASLNLHLKALHKVMPFTTAVVGNMHWINYFHLAAVVALAGYGVWLLLVVLFADKE